MFWDMMVIVAVGYVVGTWVLVDDFDYPTASVASTDVEISAIR